MVGCCTVVRDGHARRLCALMITAVSLQAGGTWLSDLFRHAELWKWRMLMVCSHPLFVAHG